MEGVGARTGRSSTRYGPAPVFTGPVRKWKKKLVHVSPSSHNLKAVNGGSSNGAHILLYKWTPVTPSQKNSSNVHGDAKEAVTESEDERPKRRFKYVPIAALEEQMNEVEENEAPAQVDEKEKVIDIDPSTADVTAMKQHADEKPDINDVPMEESQSEDHNQVVRQDLNESTLDLSLG